MTDYPDAATTARAAAEMAGRLKAGDYSSVQALSLLSIAQSLTRIAESLDREPAADA